MNEKKRANTIHGLRILAVIMLIVCVVTVSLCYLASSRNGVAVLGETQNAEPAATAPEAIPSPTATRKPLSDSKADLNARVTYPGYSALSASIHDDGIELTSRLYNPIENENLYYLIFEIRLANVDDTCKTIYTSDRCYAGQQISAGKLEGYFAPGTYDVILHLQPYRVLDDTPTDNSEQVLKLYVK